MEAEHELARELPGESDRSRDEMRFSCPLAARCTANKYDRVFNHLCTSSSGVQGSGAEFRVPIRLACKESLQVCIALEAAWSPLFAVS